MTITQRMLDDVSTLVTHANCPDGIASALIIKEALPHVKVVFVQHNTPELEQLEARPHMLFCDITPPRERAQEFVDVGAIVLDHHKGAEDVVRMFGERGVFADEKMSPGVSGAVLAYRHVYSTVELAPKNGMLVREFARRAGVRDTWQREDKDWEKACEQADALMFWGFDELDNGYFFIPSSFDRCMDVGRVVRAKHKEKVQRITKGAYKFVLDIGREIGVLIFQGTDVTSDVADFADEYFRVPPDIIAGFSYKEWQRRNDKIVLPLVVSMRSHTGVDLATIAKALGGGGHTAAAGFTLFFDPEDLDGCEPFSRILGAIRTGLIVGDGP